MKKVLLPIIVLIVLIRSGVLAQSGPNGFAMPLDKHEKATLSAPCGEDGVCVLTESATRKLHRMTFVHIGTDLKPRWDTTITLPAEWKRQQFFHDDGTVICLYRVFQKNRPTDKGILMLYHTDSQIFETKELTGLPTEGSTTDWHYHDGNLFFTVLWRSVDEVWFLPAGALSPTPFPFTQENPGQVLVTAVDTIRDKAVICFTSGGRTMYFETDFTGKSSFANILNEPATRAQWVGVGPSHSLLMLYYEDEETFYMHPVNILNRKVMPSDTVFCADLYVPQTLPESVRGKKLFIVTPYSNVSILPTSVTLMGDKVACITELYNPVYTSYFNGWYVEPRFNGYRYERADVHFFDTNGVFQTNVTVPYDETASLHSTIIRKLSAVRLSSGDILLYHRNGLQLTTMLIDSSLRVKDPVRSNALPLPAIQLKSHKLSVDRFEPWHGHNRFLLTAFRIEPISQKKVQYLLWGMEYQ